MVEHIGDATLYLGDCRTSMQSMDAGSVQCVVTSPPYWGLRDYGVDGQIGLEDSPGEYVDKMVDVFREVRRVLRDDGTVWLNLGDSYAGSGKGPSNSTIDGVKPQRHMSNLSGAPTRWLSVPAGVKSKDLIGIPWRVAFALQADGWYLRQDIIWSKPNPMPESVTDRCTKAHEYIFLLSKSARYFYDAEAIKEPSIDPESLRPEGRGQRHPDQFTQRESHRHAATRTGFAKLAGVRYHTRNKRSVWTVSTAPYSAAHFATFPPKMIEPCILAGSRPGDTVLDPFGGSGTTAGVALEHGRKAILCELSEEYGALVQARIESITDALKQPRLFPEGTHAENH